MPLEALAKITDPTLRKLARDPWPRQGLLADDATKSPEAHVAAEDSGGAREDRRHRGNLTLLNQQARRNGRQVLGNQRSERDREKESHVAQARFGVEGAYPNRSGALWPT